MRHLLDVSSVTHGEARPRDLSSPKALLTAANRGSAGSAPPALPFGAAVKGDPAAPETLPWSLTEQVAAGDAPLGDGSLHGTDGGGEDVGLLEDLGQLGTVQGAEGSGVVLLGALVQLQHGELVAPGLGVPVLVLQREGGRPAA